MLDNDGMNSPCRGDAASMNSDKAGSDPIKNTGVPLTLSLEDALKLDSYADYQAYISVAIPHKDSRRLRLSMLNIINNYSEDPKIMRRLLYTGSLPWALVHGKLICKLFMNAGIRENHPFSIRHLVFPEVYMHRLMRNQITFEPAGRVKQLTGQEIKKIMENPFISVKDAVFFATHKTDLVLSHIGPEGIMQAFGNALLNCMNNHEKFIKKEEYSHSNANGILNVFAVLESFSSYDMPWSVTVKILSKVDVLKTGIDSYSWRNTVISSLVSLLPKPLSLEMLSYILENMDNDIIAWIGRLYPEFDSTHVNHARRARKGGAAFIDGLKHNQYCQTKNLIVVGETPDDAGETQADNKSAMNQQQPNESTTGLTLRVIQNFKGETDDRIKPYSDMSDKDVPLIVSPNPEAVFSGLNELFPWAKRANEIVCRQLSIARMGRRGYAYINPLLLIGDPGVGKTRYSQELAKFLGVPMVYCSAAGSTDAVLLKGTARGWGSARPSLAVETIRRYDVANPMILVDEIDKAGSGSHNGRVEDYLHGVLEPGSARNVLDECLMIPVNLSAITWILTANRKDFLSSSLLSRLTTVTIPAPGKKHHEVVVRGVIRSVMAESEIYENQLPEVPDSVWGTFMRSASNPRMLRKMVEAWIGEAGRHITIQ
ncbi:MAG: AAA family ATPase [Desulfocucumaceae bacterium]